MSDENDIAYILDLVGRLKPTGHGGFEDFIRGLYEAWTGRRAYLSGSGSQRGGDAGGAGEHDLADCISCKRYSGRSPSERDVLGEFEQALLAAPGLDLWLLAATSPVSQQVAASLHDVAQKDGVPVVIIDHDRSVPVSRIIAFIAGQRETAAAFLSEHIKDFDTGEFQRRIAALKLSPRFEARIAEMRTLINAPENGNAAFRDAAAKKLKGDLSERSRSMRRFGQALTPFEDGVAWIERPQYQRVLNAWYESAAPAIVLAGEEMMGKSYLAARWLSDLADASSAPVPLFIPSQSVRNTDDAISLLARSCVAAVDARLSEAWWRRRWARVIREGCERVQAVVIIDGLNERHSVDWPTLVRALHELAAAGVIRLILTVRPRFWRDRLDSLKSLEFQKADISPYSDAELATALKGEGLHVSDFSPALLQLLRTPGYFQLGVRLRDRLRNDISIHRLTWEEWRYRRERRDNVSLTDEEFWTVVRRAVQDYPAKATLSLDDIHVLAGFATEAARAREDLLDARVFEANGSLPADYRISGRFAALGLGAYLLRELELAVQNEDDPQETLERALEPHSDTDFKSEIIATALFLGVQKTTAPQTVVDALADNLLRARNRPHEATLLLLFAIGHSPARMVALAERHWAREGSHEAQDVITEALLRKRDDEEARPAIIAAFNRWMRFVHPHGGTLFLNGPSTDRANKQRRAIEERVGYPLAAGDAEFKGEAIVIIEDEMLLRLRSMALYVISGGDIDPFAAAFRGWAAAGAAMHDWEPREQVQWTLRTARGDAWRSLAPAAKELAASNDPDLQRAAYQLAGAAGTEQAMLFRDQLPDGLFPVPEHAEAWAAYERRRTDPGSGAYAPDHSELVEALQSEEIAVERLAELLRKDALDPELDPPPSFIRRLKIAAAQHGEALRWSGRFTTGEQIDFERIEPTLAALAPDALKSVYNKAIARMAAEAARDGALDQTAALGLAIHVEDCALILDDAGREAIMRVHALAAAALGAESRAEDARDNLQQIEHSLFGAIFPFLTAKAQFDALTNRPPGAYLIRNFANAMKPLSAAETTDALSRLAMFNGDSLAAAFWFLSASPACPDKAAAAEALLPLYPKASSTGRGMLFRLFAAWGLDGLEREAKAVLSGEGAPESKDQRAWLRGCAVVRLASCDTPVEDYAVLLSVDEFSRVVARRKDDAVLCEGLARSIELRLKTLLALDESETPDLPKTVSIELDGEADAEGEAPAALSIDANRGAVMRAANRGGATSVADRPLFERDEEFEARVNAILKAVSRLSDDEKTSWWRSDVSLSALRKTAATSPDRLARWVAWLETAAERSPSSLWRLSGFVSLLTVALMPALPVLALRLQHLARRQDDIGRINYISAGTTLPLELVELFTAPACDDVVSERRAAIDRAANDADLATIAGCASTAEAESWLLEEARRRLAAESILERGKGLMLAALLGVAKDDFGEMIVKSKAPQTWLKASLDALERLRRRTNWVQTRIADTQTFRGERAYFVLRAARPFMHAALQAHIDHALENDEWRALERPFDRLKRDADKTQKDWEKTLLTMKIDHRIVRFPS